MKILLIILAILLVPLFMWLEKNYYHEHKKPSLIQTINDTLNQNQLANVSGSLDYLDATLTGTVQSFAERDNAQKLVDDISGVRVKQEDNKIKVIGWMQAEKDINGQISISGLLPEQLAEHKLIKAFDTKDAKLDFKAHVTTPKIFTLSSDAGLKSLIFDPAGSRKLMLKNDGFILSGDATSHLKNKWQKFTDSLAGIKAKIATRLFASLYHMPGYKLKSGIDAASAKNIAEKLKKQTVFFDSGSSNIHDSETAKIATIAKIINDTAEEVEFVAGGHADPTGNAEQNLILSKYRAEAVLEKLASLGVNTSRIEIVSFGATQAIGLADEKDQQRSRRVEILIK